jgi:ornithine cyclodeaminase
MLFLNKKNLKQVFTMKDAIAADKQAFRIYSAGESDITLRINIGVPKYDGQSIFMPGYVEGLDSMGVKIVSIFPRNIEKGTPTISATMILLDVTSGEACCIMDGTYLTQLRTGAAAGLATDLLARTDSRIGAVIGAGGQAATQLEAILAVRELAEVRVFDINLERAKSFVAQMQQELSLNKTVLRAVETSDEAVIDADIITAVTTSKKPVFNGHLVKPGAHINGFGAYTPQMQELDETIIQRADKIFFDTLEGVLVETGDFIIPLQKGTFSEERITGEIGKLIAGTLKGRETAKEITLFKSVGMAVQDIVTAYHIYQKAVLQKIGQEFIFAEK